MPPDPSGPEDPREWLRRALSNLSRARDSHRQPNVLFEDLCFDAQQASEKALKALFVLKGRQVPRTHSIGDLLTELGRLGLEIPPDVTEAAALTDYAVATRYPGPSEPVGLEDLNDAIKMAEAVFSWASGIISTST
jgi:HEPN domain-containing protein